MLEALTRNASFQKMAFGAIRKLAKENDLKAIVLTVNEGSEDGPIPGFDLSMFRDPITVYTGDVVALTKMQYDMFLRDYNNNTDLMQKNADLCVEINRLSKSEPFIRRIIDAMKNVTITFGDEDEIVNIVSRYMKAKNTDGDITAGSASEAD